MITVRASALPDFLDCAARAEAKYLLHKKIPMGSGALLGKAVHRSTAVFDSSVINQAGITIEESAGAAVDVINRPDEDVFFDDDTPQALESIAVGLHKLYCTKISPAQSYAAVEVFCERLEIIDLDIALTGTTDRVRRVDEGFGISDLKTGKSAVRADGRVETKGHTYQMGVYELLAERASGINITEPAQIIGLQAGKTANGQRVGTASISGARDVLVGEEGSPGVLEVVSAMIRSGNFPGNPRSMLCHEKYCPIYNSCRFRK
jgi:hypothetical protein